MQIVGFPMIDMGNIYVNIDMITKPWRDINLDITYKLSIVGLLLISTGHCSTNCITIGVNLKKINYSLKMAGIKTIEM